MINNRKVSKGVFKVLSGVIVGGAIGSILGLTLAPQKGADTRKAIREKSLEMFLKGKGKQGDKQKMGIVKRTVVKVLTPKRRTVTIQQSSNDNEG